jgi:hypothetical protein
MSNIVVYSDRGVNVWAKAYASRDEAVAFASQIEPEVVLQDFGYKLGGVSENGLRVIEIFEERP